MIHLLGEELVPPCIDPVLNDNAGQAAYEHGPWSPVAADVDCPACLEWVHA